MLSAAQSLASSFRDPAGFVFKKEGIIYRQVNKKYKEHYDHFILSGCYEHLSTTKLLISHTEINENLTGDEYWYKTLLPEQLLYISYSSEWSFEMLKDAALLTLNIAKESLKYGCVLKDATPFNVQWKGSKPVFIDTLSFERYDPSQPWIAYRQFCECFLSPLLLMYYKKQPLQGLQLIYPDGIPLSITRSLLPWKSKLSLYTYLHIHLHGKIASKANSKSNQSKIIFSQRKMNQLLESLTSLISTLHWKGDTTTWGDYYSEALQRENYVEAKRKIINDWIAEFPAFNSLLDIGGNDGEFSKIDSLKNTLTITADFDHTAINNLYLHLKKDEKKHIHPLLLDISNPTPSIGFNNAERPSFLERTNVDIVFALALIHHLCIGKNASFAMVAEFFSRIGNYLLIEFVPKKDEKVQYMLSQKKDIYYNYTEEEFTREFAKYFSILRKEKIGTSGRGLYLMKKHA